MLFPKRMDLFNDSFVRDMFDDLFFSKEHQSTMMKTDIKEEENEYLLDIEVPGYKKDEIKMSLDKGYLIIEANTLKENDKTDDKGTIISKERYQGKCVRSFYVGENIKEEDIKASLQNGVLKVNVPKKENKEIGEKSYITIE